MREPAPSPMTANRSDRRSTTRRVLVPIDPVEPRTAIPFTEKSVSLGSPRIDAPWVARQSRLSPREFTPDDALARRRERSTQETILAEDIAYPKRGLSPPNPRQAPGRRKAPGARKKAWR